MNGNDDMFRKIQEQYIKQICNINYNTPILKNINEVIQETRYITTILNDRNNGKISQDIPPWAKKIIFIKSNDSTMMNRYQVIFVLVEFLVDKNSLQIQLNTFTSNNSRPYEILSNYIESKFLKKNKDIK